MHAQTFAALVLAAGLSLPSAAHGRRGGVPILAHWRLLQERRRHAARPGGRRALGKRGGRRHHGPPPIPADAPPPAEDDGHIDHALDAYLEVGAPPGADDAAYGADGAAIARGSVSGGESGAAGKETRAAATFFQRQADDAEETEETEDSEDDEDDEESEESEDCVPEGSWDCLRGRWRDALEILGYDEDGEIWDDGGDVDTQDTAWDELSEREREAAMKIGYLEADWEGMRSRGGRCVTGRAAIGCSSRRGPGAVRPEAGPEATTEALRSEAWS